MDHTEPEPEKYLSYTINFHNCTFNGPIDIKQTGKPESDDPPPGTGDEPTPPVTP